MSTGHPDPLSSLVADCGDVEDVLWGARPLPCYGANDGAHGARLHESLPHDVRSQSGLLGVYDDET